MTLDQFKVMYPNENVKQYMSAVYSMLNFVAYNTKYLSEENFDEQVRKVRVIKLRASIKWVFDEHIKCVPKLKSFYGEKSEEELIDIVFVGYVHFRVLNSGLLPDGIFTDRRCLCFGMTFPL